ncbi:MAG TPA: BTAD domain-containing putative transcriptional regulator, partial [Ktedonobacteraceae bacterium]|nr:BTAD domain-containing putative transcriptional regulator [Ktedonobacteraceae bacterium]
MDNSERNQKPSKPCLRIVTLGGFQLFRRIGEQDEWEEFVERELSERGPSRVFLKVLASSGPRMSSHRRSLAQKWQEWESHEVSRDAMINALWPEDEQVPADPQRAVAVAKSVLNKALRTVAGGDVVLLTEGSDSLGYRLNMSLVTLDADEFELFVHQGSLAEGQGEKRRACALWEQADALIQGEFLPHDQYNDWSKTRRDRLLAKYRLVLHRLARCYQDAGQITEAVEKLHPHVVADPTNLDALCVLLPLLAEQGRYKEALELLEAGKQAMRQEEIPLPPVLAELASSLRRRQEAAWFQIVQTLSSEEDAERVPRASSLLLPSSPERTHDTWFTLKQQLLQTVVSQWNGRAMYCDELQIIVDQELRMFDCVKSLYHQDAYVLSRR